MEPATDVAHQSLGPVKLSLSLPFQLLISCLACRQTHECFDSTFSGSRPNHHRLMLLGHSGFWHCEPQMRMPTSFSSRTQPDSKSGCLRWAFSFNSCSFSSSCRDSSSDEEIDGRGKAKSHMIAYYRSKLMWRVEGLECCSIKFIQCAYDSIRHRAWWQ